MRRKFCVDDNVFSDFSEKSFYLAGFMAADGCINSKSEICIRLSSKDKNHLVKLNDLFESNRSIRDYDNGYTGVSVLRITSSKIVNDLEKFCVVPRKSNTLKFPEWLKDHELKHHFMRGYFDGDGSFYLNTQYNDKICFSLRGTQEFLFEYRNVLEKECGFKHRENKIPISGGQYQLGYGGNNNTICISNFLYNNATIFLERKHAVAMAARTLRKIL